MAVPADTPVTTPVELTVALLVEELLQVPPAVPEADKAVIAATQTPEAPVMDPADGVTLTVTTLVAVAAPHVFVTW